MSPELRLDGTVVIVTGAGRGLGRAHAELLAARGASVVVNDKPHGYGTTSPDATETVNAIASAGGTALEACEDISSEAGAKLVVEKAIDHFGQVGALVNNAGTFSETKAFEDTTIEDFTSLWSANFATTYYMTRAAWPHLVASKVGRVVNTTSLAGIYGISTNLDYTAAKGAILSFTLGLAAASDGKVRVNAIAPGGFTPMIEKRFPDEPTRSVVQNALRSELASPLVAWLIHEDCTAQGQIFEAMAGRVARIFTGSPDGFWDRDMTPESVLAHWDEVDNPQGVTYRAGSDEWLTWQIKKAIGMAASD